MNTNITLNVNGSSKNAILIENPCEMEFDTSENYYVVTSVDESGFELTSEIEFLIDLAKENGMKLTIIAYTTCDNTSRDESEEQYLISSINYACEKQCEELEIGFHGI